MPATASCGASSGNFPCRWSLQKRTLASQTPVHLPRAGLVITFCEVETTPIASYLSLRYALAADASALQGLNLKDGIWAHWLNEEGQPREPGDFQIVLRGLPTGETALMQSFGALQDPVSDQALISFKVNFNEKAGGEDRAPRCAWTQAGPRT